jgi:hypothetical protein
MTPRDIERLCKIEHGESPTHTTIWRQARKGWGASKPFPKAAHRAEPVEVDATQITHEQYVQAAKEILIIGQHSSELQDARARLRTLLSSLESFLPGTEPPPEISDLAEPPPHVATMPDGPEREAAYDAWAADRRLGLATWVRARNAAYLEHMRTLKTYVESLVKVIDMERRVHKLDEPGAERRGEQEQELDEGAILAIARDIGVRKQLGPETLEGEVDSIRAIHAPELPGRAVSLPDGGGDGAIDVDSLDSEVNSLYTTETW